MGLWYTKFIKWVLFTSRFFLPDRTEQDVLPQIMWWHITTEWHCYILCYSSPTVLEHDKWVDLLYTITWWSGRMWPPEQEWEHYGKMQLTIGGLLSWKQGHALSITDFAEGVLMNWFGFFLRDAPMFIMWAPVGYEHIVRKKKMTLIDMWGESAH